LFSFRIKNCGRFSVPLFLTAQRANFGVVMKTIAMICAATIAASAQAQEWKGVGEFGLAITGGNTDTQNINGKLGLSKESDAWKHEFGLALLQAETSDTKTAERYEAAWTSGYKLSETSYVFGNLRYENDKFGAYRNQTVAGLGYGIYAIKEEPTTLLFEFGAGYRRSQPQDVLTFVPTPAPGRLVRTSFDKEGDGILRGRMDFNHKLTETTVIYDTFLIEAGSDNKFMQNDLGLAVKISDAFAVKTGFQIRHNSDVAAPSKKTDRLFTTNLVYSF
jgi:putative salt-induced outer membrane protein